MKLTNKVIITTDAASYIGRALSKGYANEGAQIVVSDHNFNCAQAVANEISATGATAIALQANMTSENDVQRLIAETKKRFGKLDVFVNNSSVWDQVDVSENLHAPSHTTSNMTVWFPTITRFLRQGQGTIINILPNTDYLSDIDLTATHHTFDEYIRNIAYIYADYNIRCNGIILESMETAPYSGNPNDANLQVQELVQHAIFLSSDEGSFINGQVLRLKKPIRAC